MAEVGMYSGCGDAAPGNLPPLGGSSVKTIERALHVLIHDIRTPVGVAQGYLRLIREDRLTDRRGADQGIRPGAAGPRPRGRLCNDAAALVDDEPPPAPPVAVSADRFVGPGARAPRAGAGGRYRWRPPTGGSVAVPGDTDRLADAVRRCCCRSIATAPVAGPGGGDRGQRYASCGSRAGSTVEPSSGEALDPWRGPGFALPLACRTITNAGGRVWARSRAHGRRGGASSRGDTDDRTTRSRRRRRRVRRISPDAVPDARLRGRRVRQRRRAARRPERRAARPTSSCST